LDIKVLGRLRREISCIKALGFAPYFLVAHEAVRIARKKDIPATGWGSAANSVISYCLGLTQPEPFENRLLFERFLHEGRKDPPDVDLDLCSEGRNEVRDELIRRYERYGAAVAATAGTLSLRGAVRVAARALGHSPKEVDLLSRHVPVRFTDRDRLLNPVRGWEEALWEPAMRGHPLQNRARHKLLLELSWGLAGRLHQAGTHLGGLVFGNETHHLTELVPLEPSGKEGLLRCQYDKDDLEYVGLPKLDLLGLRMHTALRKAGELASKRLGEKLDLLFPPPPRQGDLPAYKEREERRDVPAREPGADAPLDPPEAEEVLRPGGPDQPLQARAGQGRPRRPLRDEEERPGGLLHPARRTGRRSEADLRDPDLPGAGPGGRPQGRRFLPCRGGFDPPGGDEG
jgi:hypothetical protein